MGSIVAQRFAATRPDRAAGLILVGGFPGLKANAAIEAFYQAGPAVQNLSLMVELFLTAYTGSQSTLVLYESEAVTADVDPRTLLVQDAQFALVQVVRGDPASRVLGVVHRVGDAGQVEHIFG